MKILDLKQGSPEWHQARLKHFTASEAQAMMNASKYQTRNDLLKLKKTGIQPEVTPQQQALFNKGHEAEALARPIAENIIKDDLYPVTGALKVEGLPLLASFDGITMDQSIVWEHKLWNESLVLEVVGNDFEIPATHYWQLEQQLLVSNAEKVLFTISDGTEENKLQIYYRSVPERRQALINGWKQFQKDLEAFEVQPEEIKPEATPIMGLPALSVQISGMVSASNLEQYQLAAVTYIDNIKTELATDQDFADAEENIKFCSNAEKELDSVKKQALSQTADIDRLFKAIDHLQETLRAKRLTLNKLVKSEKEARKIELLTNAQNALNEHLKEISNEINIVLDVKADFNGAMKNKRNLESMRNALDSELATAKIEADRQAKIVRANLAYYDSVVGQYKFLFNDLISIARQDAQSFQAIIDSRISRHKEEEQARLEAERQKIRKEEEQRAELERQRIRKEEEFKAEAERQQLRIDEEAKAEAEKKLAEEQAKIKTETKPVKPKPAHKETVIRPALSVTAIQSKSDPTHLELYANGEHVGLIDASVFGDNNQLTITRSALEQVA